MFRNRNPKLMKRSTGISSELCMASRYVRKSIYMIARESLYQLKKEHNNTSGAWRKLFSHEVLFPFN